MIRRIPVIKYHVTPDLVVYTRELEKLRQQYNISKVQMESIFIGRAHAGKKWLWWIKPNSFYTKVTAEQLAMFDAILPDKVERVVIEGLRELKRAAWRGA
jgi:hypothetical protein